MSLQTWLLVILISLSAIGLALTAGAVSWVMRGVLYDRVDADLVASVEGWTQDPDIYVDEPQGPPSEYAVLQITPYGQQFWLNAGDSRPNLSEVEIGEAPINVDSLPGSQHDVEWRAYGVGTNQGVTIVAKSLERENMMITGLLAAQGVISVMLLVIMGVAGRLFINAALRPLKEVESTARAIADGDLDRRVPQWSPDTEVGSLSAALNKMLTQLQGSIESSRNKENQMRRFIGDASHELRTPLTSVRGYTELYRSGATQDIDRVLDKIDEESGRMQLLVEDLLALTRAEGSRLNLSPVDLFEVTVAAASSARAAYPERVIRVGNNASDVPIVNGDKDRLHQVLINLISNGVKHGGDDAEITLELSIVDQDVVLEVRDNGRGMEPEVAEHIFERFYREDTSRSRGQGGGSGLGLSIVKGLVEQHGGTIVVETAPQEGSTFRIRLPRLINPQAASR